MQSSIIGNISEAIKLSKSTVGKDLLTVLIGNGLGAGLGFAASVLIARGLGPEQFGLFSIALVVMAIAYQFSDFGIGTSLVRFFSSHLQHDKARADLTLKISLKMRLFVTAVVFVIGFLSAESLSNNVFGKPELVFLLKLAFVGALGTSLVGYVLSTLQARQSFIKFTLVNLLTPFAKLALIGILFLTHKLNLLSAFTTVVTIPFMVLIIGSLVIPKDFLRARGNEREAVKELFHYSKWIMVSIVFVTLFGRLDVLMLAYFKDASTVGIYSAAFTLSLIIVLLLSSLVTVLLPRVMTLTTKSQLKDYIRKVLKLDAIIIVFLSPLFVLSKPVIVLLYGPEFVQSFVIFNVLLISFMIVLVTNTTGLVLHSIGKPQVSSYTNIIKSGFNFALNYMLIPLYGALGAAFATLFVYVIAMFLIDGYILNYLRNTKIPEVFR